MESFSEMDTHALPLADETLMSALFEAAGAGVYAVDEGGLVIACNPWAERLLGYEAGTLIGVDAHAILNPRAGNAAGVPEQRPVLREVALGKRVSGDRAVLLCADGSPLPVWWSAAPLPPEMGHGAGAVVVFHDISAQRKREGQRADRYAHSETMREQAEYDLSEVTWLSELTLAMVSTLEAEQSLERLARQLVPRLADTAVVHLCEGEALRPVAWAHHLPDVLPASPSEAPGLPEDSAHHAALRRVMQGAGMQQTAGPAVDGSAQTGLLGVAEAVDVLVVPLRLRATTLGALTVARAAASPPFNEADRVLADEVARRTALGLDNARLHAAQADIAATLQRALLTDLPEVSGLELAAHYQPAQRAAEVGGDWYDAFPLDGEDIALVIGDVTGHDIQAASRMSELRNMLRALAVDRPEEGPGQILRRLDTAQSRLTLADAATVILARLSPSSDGRWELSWSVAGHPPPLLLTAESTSTYLTGPSAMLLGLRPTMQRPTARMMLPAGSTLVLYTDGLVESRSQDIDTGMTRLRQYTDTHRGLPLPRLCADLARDLGDTRDDITLLAARTPGTRG
ncbi:SpoIIE family protein phosphatase [Streptomyces collinus]|uniref:SpoIIE family protein phosphatase n=1 Tax=Streptomyces collinus TaxID=42684 RepID=UPI00342EA4C8